MSCKKHIGVPSVAVLWLHGLDVWEAQCEDGNASEVVFIYINFLIAQDFAEVKSGGAGTRHLARAANRSLTFSTHIILEQSTLLRR